MAHLMTHKGFDDSYRLLMMRGPQGVVDTWPICMSGVGTEVPRAFALVLFPFFKEERGEEEGFCIEEAQVFCFLSARQGF